MPVSEKRTMSFTEQDGKIYCDRKECMDQSRGSPDGSGSSYTLYDSCNKCPLRAYIEMVCNDNLRALVIGGIRPKRCCKRSAWRSLQNFTNSPEMRFAVR